MRNGKEPLLMLIILSIPVLFSSLKFLSANPRPESETWRRCLVLRKGTDYTFSLRFSSLPVGEPNIQRNAYGIASTRTVQSTASIVKYLLVCRPGANHISHDSPAFSFLRTRLWNNSDKACTSPQRATHVYTRLLRRLKLFILNSSFQATETVLRRLSGLIAHFHLPSLLLFRSLMQTWPKQHRSNTCYTMPHVQMLAIPVSAPYPLQCVQRLGSLQGLFSSP